MDYEDLGNFEELRNKWNHGKKFIWLIVVGAILFISGFSSFYTIEPDERGIVQRFGRYVRKTEPGLHFKFPAGIEKVRKVKVEYVFKEEFGFRTDKPGIRTTYSTKNFEDESIMLSGDLNIADVEWVVQFKVKDPYKMLFKVRNPGKIIRDISEAVVRQIVGDRSISDVLTVGRIEISNKAKEAMQGILDSYDSGIHIVTIKLQDVNPPDLVKPAFNEVNEAKQEKEKMINEAWENYNRIIPKAKGEAEKIISESEGYALKRVNRAQGDANRFLAMYSEYTQAEDVTRKRLYLEAMGEILPKAGRKYIVDPDQKSLLPLLKLGKEVVE